MDVALRFKGVVQQFLKQLAFLFLVPAGGGVLGNLVGFFQQRRHQRFVLGQAADFGLGQKGLGIAGDHVGAAGGGRRFHFDDDIEAAHGGRIHQRNVVAHPHHRHGVVFEHAVEPGFVETEMALAAVKQVFDFVEHQHGALAG